MAKITKEGKEIINEKNQSAYCGWYYRLCNQKPQVLIQFIFKPSAIPKEIISTIYKTGAGQFPLTAGARYRGLGLTKRTMLEQTIQFEHLSVRF
jgi:hypothetical protein